MFTAIPPTRPTHRINAWVIGGIPPLHDYLKKRGWSVTPIYNQEQWNFHRYDATAPEEPESHPPDALIIAGRFADDEAFVPKDHYDYTHNGGHSDSTDSLARAIRSVHDIGTQYVLLVSPDTEMNTALIKSIQEPALADMSKLNIHWFDDPASRIEGAMRLHLDQIENQIRTRNDHPKQVESARSPMLEIM